MQVLQFIAPDAASALAQINKQLGPEAVVLSARPLPAQGISRLLAKNNRIEVLAGLPDKDLSSIPPTPFRQSPAGASNHAAASGRWQSIAWLESMGLLPGHANQLQNQLCASHGKSSPFSCDEEWAVVHSKLKERWRNPKLLDEGFITRPHVFIGPPGSGKTTALCKWLTLSVLTEERRTRVWRLDGTSANTSEFLTIHCEMLGAPVERFWSLPGQRGELIFVDLPGVEASDRQALEALRNQLSSFPNPHIHVVLNAAYESDTLIQQWEAFTTLGAADVILTHLDEERRRIKLWNLLFGTNCTIRFLSAGQKIPGLFQKASADLLFPSETTE